MDIEQLKKRLSSDEGRVACAYVDSLGFLTIGVGHLIDKRKGGRISDAAIDFIFNEDVDIATKALFNAFPWVSDLNDARQNALVNMVFQLGIGGVSKFVQTLLFLKNHDYENAATAMMQSNWAKQTPERAQRAADLIRTGAFPDA